MPLHMQSALIFHYNLKFYNKDADNFEGVSLKRFVMQVRAEWIQCSDSHNLVVLSPWWATRWPSECTRPAPPTSCWTSSQMRLPLK